jgi:hypothetical protein
MSMMPTNPDRVFTGLTEAQADGLACVECGADLATAGVSSYPVGVSETGSQVFACFGECSALTIVRGLKG